MVWSLWKKTKEEKTTKIEEEIKTQMEEVERYIHDINEKIKKVKGVVEKIKCYKKINIKELEGSLFDVYIEETEILEKNFKEQVGKYISYRDRLKDEKEYKKEEYIKQITELKKGLGNLEKEIDRYKIVGEFIEKKWNKINKVVENKINKVVEIINKYLKTSSNYNENAQKIIEALDYDKEDLIDAYKLGIELGYSREQLKNISAAIALKESMKQRDKVIKSIGEDPDEIRMYIVKTAVNANKALKKRLYEEIYK